jgi:TfoX/Sxy family transcriptional regulator of competence genes
VHINLKPVAANGSLHVPPPIRNAGHEHAIQNDIVEKYYMASDKEFVDYVVDQMKIAGFISSRKMMGEYVVYCNQKVIGLICDNQLFIKPTEKGRTYIGNVIESPAYPGAKPSFLIDGKLDDQEWLGELVKITFLELPENSKKQKKSRK